MAGSWRHMTKKNGKPYDRRFGEGSMLENGGDVIEALEECYGMVWWLAWIIAYRDDMNSYVTPGHVPRGKILDVIGQAQANYPEGVTRGKGKS